VIHASAPRSAGGYPVVLCGPLQLPPIAPQSPTLFAALRETHTVLALLLFATFPAHLTAALMHALIFRGDVFPSMTSFRFAGDREADPQRAAEARAATVAARE